MSLLLGATCIAFGAFCVWLGVRIVNRRERWAKRVAVGMAAVLVLYVASFGPACWWLSGVHGLSAASNSNNRIRRVPQLFRPIVWSAVNIGRRGPKQLQAAVKWYASLGMGNDTLECDIDWDGRQITFPLVN